MRTAQHRAREVQRDSLYANTDTPAPRGEPDSSVGVDVLTRLAHDRIAAAAPSSTLSPELDASIRAGLPPQGQPRPVGDSGVRPRTGGPTQNQRGKGTTGPAR